MTMDTWYGIALAALVVVSAVLHKLHWTRSAALADKLKALTGAK